MESETPTGRWHSLWSKLTTYSYCGTHIYVYIAKYCLIFFGQDKSSKLTMRTIAKSAPNIFRTQMPIWWAIVWLCQSVPQLFEMHNKISFFFHYDYYFIIYLYYVFIYIHVCIYIHVSRQQRSHVAFWYWSWPMKWATTQNSLSWRLPNILLKFVINFFPFIHTFWIYISLLLLPLFLHSITVSARY